MKKEKDFKKGFQGRSSWLLEPASVDGVVLVCWDGLLVGSTVPVLWLTELGLVSLQGRAVSNSRFWSVHGFSMPLGSSSSFLSVHSVQYSCSVISDSLPPHESQRPRPSCPSQNPGVYSNSCPSSCWCHPATSSSVVPFPPAPNPSQQKGLFQWVNSSHQVAKVLESQLQ